MSKLFLLFLLLVATHIVSGQHYETDRFVFRNSVWVNLHHFLYGRASESQIQYMALATEDSIVNTLDSEERRILDNAVRFYKQHVIQRDLLFDEGLYKFKVWLSHQDTKGLISSEEGHIVEVLNSCYSFYEKRIWPFHNEANISRIEEWVNMVSQLEKSVMPRLERLTGESYPQDKIDVDVSFYTSWSGAYTNGIEPISITIASADNRSLAEYGYEILFHESSHLLLWPGSSMGLSLRAESAKQGKKISRNFWHVLLFYLTGVVVQQELIRYNMTLEPIYMKRNNVFTDFINPEFELALRQFAAESISRDQMIKRVVTSHK